MPYAQKPLQDEPSRKRLLKLPEVMAILGLSKSVVYGLLMTGELRSVKIGRCRRVPIEAVDEFLERIG